MILFQKYSGILLIGFLTFVATGCSSVSEGSSEISSTVESENEIVEDESLLLGPTAACVDLETLAMETSRFVPEEVGSDESPKQKNLRRDPFRESVASLGATLATLATIPRSEYRSGLIESLDSAAEASFDLATWVRGGGEIGNYTMDFRHIFDVEISHTSLRRWHYVAQIAAQNCLDAKFLDSEVSGLEPGTNSLDLLPFGGWYYISSTDDFGETKHILTLYSTTSSLSAKSVLTLGVTCWPGGVVTYLSALPSIL